MIILQHILAAAQSISDDVVLIISVPTFFPWAVHLRFVLPAGQANDEGADNAVVSAKEQTHLFRIYWSHPEDFIAYPVSCLTGVRFCSEKVKKMFSGIGSGIDIANLNSLPTDLTLLFQTALKDHRSAQLVIFAHLVLCCFVDVGLWCSELSINQPSWVRPCLKLVREAVLWMPAELGWSKAGVAAHSQCCQVGGLQELCVRLWESSWLSSSCRNLFSVAAILL